MSNKLFLSYLVCLLFVMACKPNKEIPKEQKYQQDLIQLDLIDTFDPKRIVSSFPRFGLQLMCVLEIEKNHCVYQFDKTKISYSDIFQFLKNEVGVEGAYPSEGCPDS